MRHTNVSAKVQLPHERYAEMSAKLPELIERALRQAAGGAGGAPSGSGTDQSSPAVGAPLLLTYTHFKGCLAAVLQFGSEHALPPTRRIEAELAQLLPEGMQLVRVVSQDVSSSPALLQQQCSSGTSAPAGCVWPWPDPIAVGAGTSCSVDVVLQPCVLQQLPGGGGQQQLRLRVVLAAAGGEVLSDGAVEVDMQADLALGGGGAVKVCALAPSGHTDSLVHALASIITGSAVCKGAARASTRVGHLQDMCVTGCDP
jgi:hypothetical protein